MDFFGHQDAARAASGRLIALFVLAVLAIVAAVVGAAAAASYAISRSPDPGLLALVALGTLLVIGSASLWQMHHLRQGGGEVARQLGGRRVAAGTTDPKERQLLNVVEEMAIAAGLPMPEVWVLDDEPGLNAFAAGTTPRNAAVAVTRGLLDHLDRDELQGVIAHEFSHVFHGDMRLNLRLMGLLFGIVCIAVAGRGILNLLGRGRMGRSEKNGGMIAGMVLFGALLMVIGWLGVLCARLIQAAVSRQREFLADASAVQYTRNPRGIGLALAKIQSHGGRLHSANTEAASHLLFADGLRRWFGGLATHPPLEERIERVLPGYRVAVARSGAPEVAAAAVAPPPAGPVSGLAGPGHLAPGVASDDLLASIGAPNAQNLHHARVLLHDLPLDLVASARDSQRAPGLVLALLVDSDPTQRAAQFAALESHHPGDWSYTARELADALKKTLPAARLPLLDLALPTLRRLPPQAREALRHATSTLAHADGRLSPFEFALLALVGRELPPAGLRRATSGRPLPLSACRDQVAVVLSVLAHTGSHEPTAASAAFAAAVAALGTFADLRLQPAGAATTAALPAALEALAGVSPVGKRNLLAACATAAAHDGTVAPAEVELLRAFAATWDVPVPLPATA